LFSSLGAGHRLGLPHRCDRFSERSNSLSCETRSWTSTHSSHKLLPAPQSPPAPTLRSRRPRYLLGHPRQRPRTPLVGIGLTLISSCSASESGLVVQSTT